MRLSTLRISMSIGFAVAFGLGAAPAAAHPTIDVANPQPNDRVTPGSLVMEGLAFDHDAKSGAGVDRVSARICGPDGQFLGDARLGLPSTMSIDHGAAQYANAGWKLTAVFKGAGDLRDVCVTARSAVTGTETLVRIPITIGTTPPPPGVPATLPETEDAPGTGGSAPDTAAARAGPSLATQGRLGARQAESRLAAPGLAAAR